jgi:TPR repeat protein
LNAIEAREDRANADETRLRALREQAEQGHAEAQYELGVCYADA